MNHTLGHYESKTATPNCKEAESPMNFVKVGKIHSAQGIRGDIYVYLFAEEAYWVKQWSTLYLGEINDTEPKKSLEINKIKLHQKQKKVGFVLSIESINNRNLAEELVGKSVFVPNDFLVSKEGEGLYLREIMGFRVLDQKRGDVGEVVGFSGNDFQDLIVVQDIDNETFEVPFVEPLLIEIDKENKILKMNIPFGLVAGEEL